MVTTTALKVVTASMSETKLNRSPPGENCSSSNSILPDCIIQISDSVCSLKKPGEPAENGLQSTLNNWKILKCFSTRDTAMPRFGVKCGVETTWVETTCRHPRVSRMSLMDYIEAGIRHSSQPNKRPKPDQARYVKGLMHRKKSKNLHAFGNEEAPEKSNNFKDLANDVSIACGGSPLTLKVIGCSSFDKISDFGVSQMKVNAPKPSNVITESLNQPEYSVYTIYPVPETSMADPRQQLKTACWSERDVWSEADIYSFGMVCYEALTGKIPFVGSAGMTCYEIITGNAPFVGWEGVGGIGKTALCNRVFNEELSKHLKHTHAGTLDEEIRENRDAKGRLTNLAALSHVDDIDMGTESNFEASDSESLVPSADIGPQMPESVFGVKFSILSEDEPARKRIRTRNWTADEVRTFLVLKEQALGVVTGLLRVDSWDYVSENLWEHGFDRSANSCKDMWGTLLQSYMAVRDDESNIRAFTEFDLECRGLIERILTAKATRMNPGIPSSHVPLSQIFHSNASGMGHFGDNLMYDELNGSEMEEIDTQSEDEELSGDSTVTIESQAEVTADSYASPTYGLHESCYATNSNCAGRKRSAATVMEDDLISMIAPFVNKQIEDALKPLLSVVRSREEEEQMYREKLLAMEEQKLALKRQKILFTHRVLANSNALRPSRPQFHHEPKLSNGFVKPLV